jgi:hypothetical protein
LARVLIVGCGCRGRELSAALITDGHAVRGTTRSDAGVEAIEATGAEGVVADPNRLSTLLPRLEGVVILCWLMGSAVGEPEAVAALHGPRLESLLARVVDSPLRGVVYEGVGRVQRHWLEQGAAIVSRAGETHQIPFEIVGADPAQHEVWLEATHAAVARLLAPG